jgi:hypothetical protein
MGCARVRVALALQPRPVEGDPEMSSVIALLLLTFALCGARPASAQDLFREELPVTIRIHDYTHAPGGVVSQASRIVSGAYAGIGVRTEWLAVARPMERKVRPADRTEQSPGRIAQITINLVTPKMAARGRLGDGALGFSAVATEGMGRIGYVIYDRVRETAQQASMSVDDLLAFVMARVIARLLVPADSPLGDGLMQTHWTIDEVRRLDVRRLDFPPLVASLMRATIENDVPALAARAARAGSRQAPTAESASGVDQSNGR